MAMPFSQILVNKPSAKELDLRHAPIVEIIKHVEH
jgi:hypothetical protein